VRLQNRRDRLSQFCSEVDDDDDAATQQLREEMSGHKGDPTPGGSSPPGFKMMKISPKGGEDK